MAVVVASIIIWLIGGLFVSYMFTLIWEWALFKRVMDDPVAGKLSAVVAGWLTAGTLVGYYLAGRAPFAWSAYLYYLGPAIVLAILGYLRGRKLRAQIVPDYEELADDFR